MLLYLTELMAGATDFSCISAKAAHTVLGEEGTVCLGEIHV